MKSGGFYAVFFCLHLAMKKKRFVDVCALLPPKKNMLFYNRKLMASNGECKNVRASLTLTHIPSKRKLRYLVPVAISRTQLASGLQYISTQKEFEDV